MTSRARLLATVLLLAPIASACGREQQAPVVNRPVSPAPGVAATESAAAASPSAATPTTPPQPAALTVPAVAATARPPATAAPKAPVTAQATPPQAQSAAPPNPAPPRPPGKVTLPAKLGAVTLDHEKHAGKLGIVCTTCHHPSRPQASLASETRACRDCHTMPPTPPVKTSLQAAFHDPRGATGTCIDCHKQKGGSAPVKCLECHKKK